MPSAEGDLEMLSQAVMTQARAEADQVVAEARARAESIRQQTQAQAEAEAQEILARASQSAERIRRQAVASAELQARMRKLEQREKLLRAVFDAACQQLASVQQQKDYEQIAGQMLREALTHLGADTAQIRADAVTRQWLTEATLAAVSKDTGMKLHLGEPLAEGLGVKVQTEDGRRHYDNTLETRLDRLLNALRGPVYHILMGEAL